MSDNYDRVLGEVILIDPRRRFIRIVTELRTVRGSEEFVYELPFKPGYSVGDKTEFEIHPTGGARWHR